MIQRGRWRVDEINNKENDRNRIRKGRKRKSDSKRNRERR